MGNDQPVVLASLDFVRSVEDIYQKYIIRRCLPELEDQPRLRIWLEEEYLGFTELYLDIGDEIEIHGLDYNCPNCHQARSELYQSQCTSCYNPEEAFVIRSSCLFRQPDSPLMQTGSCTKEAPPCGVDKNKDYCHSRYGLYFGRFANIVKVGITRLNRHGGYRQRLIEQGLQEAIVITPFVSMPEALAKEQDFINMGFVSKIESRDKLDQLQIPERIALKHLFPLNLLEEYFPEYDIISETLYEDHHYSELQYMTQSQIKGVIDAIIGKYLILNYRQQHWLLNTEVLSNREIRQLIINQEVII